MQKKEEGVLQQINKLTRGDLDDFLSAHNICSMCLVEKGIVSFLQNRNGEQVCPQCGYVPDTVDFDERIPVGTVMNPENQMSFGRELGGTLGRKGLFCVLAKGAGVQDLPIRSRHITVMTTKLEHPKIMTMLRLGRQLCHDWGFDNHKEKQSIIFSNHFGNMLRTVGTWLIHRGTRCNTKKIVNACFALSLLQIKGELSYRHAVDKFKIEAKMLEDITNILALLEETR